MCIFYCSLRKKRHTTLNEDTDIHSQLCIHEKDLNICLTHKEFSCTMVLIMRPSTILKFQFVFGFNECLWAIFPLINFENFWFYIWLELYSFWFYNKKITLSHLLPHANESNKLECKDRQIDFKMLRKICKEEV